MSQGPCVTITQEEWDSSTQITNTKKEKTCASPKIVKECHSQAEEKGM